ncbi:MAG: hypothetical protein RI538_05480, partial [Salibaculum sp.]
MLKVTQGQPFSAACRGLQAFAHGSSVGLRRQSVPNSPRGGKRRRKPFANLSGHSQYTDQTRPLFALEFPFFPASRSFVVMFAIPDSYAALSGVAPDFWAYL